MVSRTETKVEIRAYFTENTTDLDGDWNFLTINGNADVKFVAPYSGQTDGLPSGIESEYEGWLFWEDAAAPDNKPGHRIVGTSDSLFVGVIYFPTRDLFWGGESTTADWVMIAVDNLTISGTAAIPTGGFNSARFRTRSRPSPYWSSKQGGVARRRNVRTFHRKGSVTVELALTAPLLMLMMVGATDFARVFYHAVEVVNASGTGAFFGSGSIVRSGVFGKIDQLAQNDAADLENVIVTPTFYCDCPGNTQGPVNKVDCNNDTCGSYGMPRPFSQVTVEQTFNPIFPWPGVPNPIRVSRTSFFRVQ